MAEIAALPQDQTNKQNRKHLEIITMPKHLTSYDISANLNLVEIMRETQRQHGTEGLIDCIIEFCCENADFTFEDSAIARLQKFKADNQ